ncbi:Late embryogenesis abundant protein [Nymphaea thermarum]|nr:Late embryogenesis abundant protein [Nymphaea thermarum]
MASQGQDIRYKAGELAGQAQVKKDELMDKGRDAAQNVKEKASSGMQAAKDAANSAADKCCSAAESGKSAASDCKNQTSGFLQQTGEQAMSMAQGAAEAVKNTLGIGSGNNKSS